MSPQRLQAIIDRALDAGLFDHRKALLRHIPNRTRGSMRITDRPDDQLRSDLHFLHNLLLNQTGLLIGWLRIAQRLTQGATHTFFGQQINHLTDLHPSPGIHIRWSFAPDTPRLGDVNLPPDTRMIVLGRRHSGKQVRGFVPLISAPWRVSKHHVGIEVLADGLRIKRPGDAGMLGCDGWLPRGGSRVVGRSAVLDLAGVLRVTVEVR
jgi:hypothetical protein